MIPKKIRRLIVVNKQQWEYCITGRDCASIFLHNLDTNEKMSWYMEGEGIRIGPKAIKELIEKKELWRVKAK